MLCLAAGLLFCNLPTAAASGGRPSASVDQVRVKVLVSGTVVDATGAPLPGATVRERATGNGTVTNIDGHFSLSVSSEASLEVSFVGYATKVVSVAG